MSSVYTTVDKGRLHVAFDEHYQGSINSYNNWFTRSYAKVCKSTERVLFNGENVLVNKKSYIKFLNDLNGTAQFTSDNLPTEFNSQICAVKIDRGLMRTHLSTKRTNQLGRRMVDALVKNDAHLAKKYIGKGADVDQHFWYLERSHNPKVVFRTHFSSSLPQQRIEPFKASRYTPLLYSSATGQNEVTQFLTSVKASKAPHGETCHFSREIMECKNNTTVDPTIRSHVYVPRRRPGDRHPPRAQVVNQLGVDVVNTQTLVFRDTYANRHRLSLRPDGRVAYTPAKESTHTVEWSRTSQTGRYPLL